MSGVDVLGGGADSLVPLPMNVPIFSFVFRLLRSKIDVSHLQDHLQTDVPEFALQIDKDEVLVLPLVIEPLGTCTMLRGLEESRFSNDHRLAAKFCEVESLILVAGGFKVDERLVEEGQKCVDEFLEKVVKVAVDDRIDIIDIAGDAVVRY